MEHSIVPAYYNILSTLATKTLNNPYSNTNAQIASPPVGPITISKAEFDLAPNHIIPWEEILY